MSAASIATALAPYQSQINASAQKYGVDPALLSALIYSESSGDPNATSNAGAQGLGQLMPATAAALGVSNAYDPAQNIDGSAHYLAEQLAKYKGNLSDVLAAYNAGPGAVDQYGGGANVPYKETQNYIATVSANYRALLGSGNSLSTLVAGSTTSVNTTTTTTSGGGGFFQPVIDAAGTLAQELFLGSLAIALISGGLIWMGAVDAPKISIGVPAEI